MVRGAGCDGRRLLAALEASAAWLDEHRAAIDALNVFPVPDGDTGTNMSLTLSAALREAQSSPAHEAGAIAERAAYGALMGARGNSGVILSQLLRGFARALQDRHHVGPAELVAALTAAAETAGRAVMKPVEGTILTVATAAARVAQEVAARDADLITVLDATLEATRVAVARTPEQLPILKQAGVVDAGAQGYALILEGAARYLHNLPTRTTAAGAAASTSVPGVPGPALQGHTAHVAHGDDYGYCTEFVVVGPHLDVAAVREAIATLGDSTLVVGEEGIVRVHIHTHDPGRVLSYAAPLGRLHKVKIESMQDQHDRFVAGAGASESSSLAPTLPPLPTPSSAAGGAQGHTGVVVVAPGDGLAEVCRSLGVGAVVRGGQTMNPSTEEMLAAIDALPQEEVLLLPNNGNVLLTAAQARDLSRKAVEIVPARTIPQGIAALMAYSADADLETNAAAMADATRLVRTGEVTVAVRDAQLDGLSVRAGQALGLLDEQAVLVGPNRDDAALDLLERMGAADADILTVYYGAGVTEVEAQALAEEARRRYAGLEVEVVEGGQPHYPYILSLE